MNNTQAYVYALVGIGFIILMGGVLLGSSQEPSEKLTSDTMMTITSSAFENGGTIPSQYTCDGDRTLSPALMIANVPEGAKSLVLLMDDPDVPKARRPDGVFDHWTLYNIPPDTREIPEGGSAGEAGLNGAGASAYAGPCPPPEYEPSEHRYFFKLYALSDTLSFEAPPTKKEALQAMEGIILEKAELMGRYDRKK